MPISDKEMSRIIKDFKKSETEEFLAERKRKKDFFQLKYSYTFLFLSQQH